MSEDRDFLVRTMAAADLARILEIEEASFSTPWSRATFQRLLSQANAGTLVAVADGTVVGYAVYWRVRDEVELGNLAVDPGHRRRGVARRLLHAVLASARREGATALYLEVRESNRAARSLYAGEGFRNVGRRRGYYRSPAEDALVLWRTLEDPEGVGTRRSPER